MEKAGELYRQIHIEIRRPHALRHTYILAPLLKDQGRGSDRTRGHEILRRETETAVDRRASQQPTPQPPTPQCSCCRARHQDLFLSPKETYLYRQKRPASSAKRDLFLSPPNGLTNTLTATPARRKKCGYAIAWRCVCGGEGGQGGAEKRETKGA